MIDSRNPTPGTPLSYKQAGVDIDTGNRLIEQIKPFAARTQRPGILGSLGGFGALFEVPTDRFSNPILVSSTDGVGTKLKLAQQMNQHHTIGIDLVAMCVNDVLVQGAEPLFFLDYFATGQLDLEVATQIIEGIAEGCCQAKAALIGGETAEMPGMYNDGDYDLAGFCVGIVEKTKLLDGQKVRPGHSIVGLASSGLHSNGYSLVRKIIETGRLDLRQPFGDITIGQTLLAPTRIYVTALLPLIQENVVCALAHITGGGLTENLPRVLPEDCGAQLFTENWPRPKIFDWIQEFGQVEETEMLRTFNCGVGMAVIVTPSETEVVIQHCKQHGMDAWNIGEIISDPGTSRILYA